MVHLEDSNEDLIQEYINLLNDGVISIKMDDREHRFRNGSKIRSFFCINMGKIVKQVNSKEYDNKYILARKLINDYIEKKKIEEYIEFLLSDEVAINKSSNVYFSDGSLVDNFYEEHKEAIFSYFYAKKTYKYSEYGKVRKIFTLEKRLAKVRKYAQEYIELINKKIITPRRYEKYCFSDGKTISYFALYEKAFIARELTENPKYKSGYETAKDVLFKYYTGDKIEEYIELINKRDIFPVNVDYYNTFADKTPIYNFFLQNKRKIVDTLKSAKYKHGYETAKNAIRDYGYKNYLYEYIEMVETGSIIPKEIDNEHKFSTGRIINKYYLNNKDKIIKELRTNPKYAIGYEKAKNTIMPTTSTLVYEFIKIVNKYRVKLENIPANITLSNGTSLIDFYTNNYMVIKRELSYNALFNKGYEGAKDILLNKQEKKSLAEFDTITLSQALSMLDIDYLLFSHYFNVKRKSEPDNMDILLKDFCNQHKVNYVKVIEVLKLSLIFPKRSMDELKELQHDDYSWINIKYGSSLSYIKSYLESEKLNVANIIMDMQKNICSIEKSITKEVFLYINTKFDISYVKEIYEKIVSQINFNYKDYKNDILKYVTHLLDLKVSEGEITEQDKDYLIYIFNKLVNIIYNVRYIMVGMSPTVKEMVELINEYSMDEYSIEESVLMRIYFINGEYISDNHPKYDRVCYLINIILNWHEISNQEKESLVDLNKITEQEFSQILENTCLLDSLLQKYKGEKGVKKYVEKK